MDIMKAIQTGFFTHEIQLRRIDQIGDPLSAISRTIDFESFRPVLNKWGQSNPFNKNCKSESNE